MKFSNIRFGFSFIHTYTRFWSHKDGLDLSQEDLATVNQTKNLDHKNSATLKTSEMTRPILKKQFLRTGRQQNKNKQKVNWLE